MEEIAPYVAKIQEETGIPWQVMAAQVCLESGYGKNEIIDSITGERTFNIFGIKYNEVRHGKGNYVEVWTKEEIKPNELESYKKQHPEIESITKLSNGNYQVRIKDKFAKFESMEDAFDKYRDTLLNQNFKHALRSANDPITYIKDIQSQLPGESHSQYATDSEYVNSIISIMKTYKMLEDGIKIVGDSTQNNSNLPNNSIGTKIELSVNTKGPNAQVKQLQQKLNELGYTDANGKKLVVDGYFGANTLAAINKYKDKNGLSNNGQYKGIVGITTWETLMIDNKVITSQASTNNTYTPSKGYDRSHVNGQFGTMYYRTGNKASNGHLLIERDPKWEAENLVYVKVPEVIINSGKINGASRLRVNKNVEKQWKQVLKSFEENPELLSYVKYIDPGTSYARYITGSTTTPSNHCWGTAIDINAGQYPMGKKININDKNNPQVILWEKVFKPAGFSWGNDYADPMHFEITSF